MEDDQRKTLTVDEAASVLGISAITLYRTIERGECPIPIVRIGRRVLISREGLGALLRGEPAARTTSDAS